MTNTKGKQKKTQSLTLEHSFARRKQMARKKSNDETPIDVYFLVALLREKLEKKKELFPAEDRELVFCLWWMLKQFESRHPI